MWRTYPEWRLKPYQLHLVKMGLMSHTACVAPDQSADLVWPLTSLSTNETITSLA
ncbi:hypothetical protein DPMN_028995 [Dreissena polymorpha]|uniref:Uncharacterized protein n=1 Tax=Dreissena polymorpha TaxID=45954 RepID=A0A9D4LYC7_DREPO|nr:hypothetical protein DPMN_028995 [Dreissena polymorpha]